MAEDTAPQLGECSGQLRVNMTATEPALICHTYMSCIAQIVAAGKQLAGVNRFCSAICPQEILGTVT
ncbi:hypothetical protein PF005_g27618 [Phytophthora fragariae]|uniref:Uncharacterized protein n=1 Tax=Phytophthora fragariae TaxID=53985 RepID=A0A6A3XC02_9STRA|nr:hypothetical protein PF005_g27618 [Phytophthora fragariae]KAE9199488.1 hypothetical protein PF002_g22133 [Phytophthora fragariae]